MSKIYYNVKQFKNALATGLLGLATLGPMTSCEKEEHGNFNNDGIEMTDIEDEDTNDNNKEQNVDKGEVSEDDVLFGKYKGMIDNSYCYHYNDNTEREDLIVDNKKGKFLHCIIKKEGKQYIIIFNIIDNNGNLEYKRCSPEDKNTKDIFNIYRINDIDYEREGCKSPVLPLK